MMHRPLLAAAVAGAALTSTSCGGSAGSSAPAAMNGMTMSRPAVAAQPAAPSARVRSGHITVAIENFAFRPSMLTVKAGTRVTFVNQDATAHTATADHGEFGTGSIAPHGHRTIRLTRTGHFPYHCLFHAFMTGTITVMH